MRLKILSLYVVSVTIKFTTDKITKIYEEMIDNDNYFNEKSFWDWADLILTFASYIGIFVYIIYLFVS